MPLLPDSDLLPDDPALQGGEWLYRCRGEVFGPVDSRHLAGLLYRGEIDGGTPVSSDGDRWLPVGEVSVFRLHARKAEAALRVAEEVTGARMLRQRKARRKVGLVVGLVAALVGGAAAAPFLLAPARGPVSPLLEDFGEGIRVASARVMASSSTQARADEVEVAIARGGSAAPARREEKAARSTARPPSPGAAGDLVESHFDPGRIQTIVNREQRSLVPCIREEASRSSDFHGEVPLEFAIGNDGRVVALWIDEPRFKQGPLRDCLLRALSAWRFDSFPGQRPTVQLAFSIR
jgi:hypothetical protein